MAIGRHAGGRGGLVRASRPGEMLGLVGEFGLRQDRDGAFRSCGSSRSRRGASRAGGSCFRGEDLLELDAAGFARACAATGSRMIFQEPMTSLNPVFTIGDQIAEAVLLHRAGRPRRRARARAVELLDLVGIPPRLAPLDALSAPALRRPAPARDDRDGARVRAAAPRSPTSRRPRSTSPCRRRSSISSTACSASSAWPCCSSPTISASWPSSATGSR